MSLSKWQEGKYEFHKGAFALVCLIHWVLNALPIHLLACFLAYSLLGAVERLSVLLGIASIEIRCQ